MIDIRNPFNNKPRRATEVVTCHSVSPKPQAVAIEVVPDEPIVVEQPVAKEVEKSVLDIPTAPVYNVERPQVDRVFDKTEEVESVTIDEEVPSVAEIIPEEQENPAEEVNDEEPIEQTTNYSPAVEGSQVEVSEESAPVEDVVAPQIHYFYCKKPDGTEVTYKKSTATKSYATEVPAFRKYLANQGIIINREEIK